VLKVLAKLDQGGVQTKRRYEGETVGSREIHGYEKKNCTQRRAGEKAKKHEREKTNTNRRKIKERPHLGGERQKSGVYRNPCVVIQRGEDEEKLLVNRAKLKAQTFLSRKSNKSRWANWFSPGNTEERKKLGREDE